MVDPYGMGGGSLEQMAAMGMLPEWFSAAFFIFMLFIAGVYVYLALAHMEIGRKAKLSNPGVSWISPVVTNFEIAKMHWWPWPTMIIGYIFSYSLMLFSPVFAVILMYASIIFISVMCVIWQWKTYEAIKRPGWWSLIPPIGVVLGLALMISMYFIGLAAGIIGLILLIIAIITYLILIGIAAWG